MACCWRRWRQLPWLDMPLAVLFTATAVEGRRRLAFLPAGPGAGFHRQGGWAGLETLGSRSSAPAGGGRRAVLALPAAGRHGLAGAPRGVSFSTCCARCRSWCGRPWMVLAAGLGPFAGTLALALHTTRGARPPVCRALENSPPTPAEALAGRCRRPRHLLCTARCRSVAPSGWPYACIAGR